MTEEQYLELLLDSYVLWDKSYGKSIPPADSEALRYFINDQYGLPENAGRIYPACISRKLYSWFAVNMGYGLEDILNFARFMQDELEVG